jgi:hypothetical protein
MALNVWLPKGFNLNKSYALQALSTGTATAEQQKEALKYIVEDLCAIYGVTFDADNARLDAHNQGRAYIGHAIVQITKLRLHEIAELLTKEKVNDGSTRPKRSRATTTTS